MSSIETRRLARLAASLRSSGAAGKHDDPLGGMVWMTVAMALLAGLGAFTKYLALAGVPPLELVFLRNLMVLLFLSPMLLWRGPSLLTTARPFSYGLRSLVMLVSMFCWFTALTLIPMGEVTAITFLSPLFGTVFAVLFLGEVVGQRRWTALLVGFLGAMVILRPGGSDIGMGQMLALVAALMMGIAGPLIKQLTATDDADKIVFLSHVIIVPLSLVPALLVWQWPPLELWPLIALMGLTAVLGHMALMRGFAATDASLAFTFEFSRLPFAVLLGFIVFGEITDLLTWVGALIIFGSAVYISRRETELKRERMGLVRPCRRSDPLCLTPLRLRLVD